MSSELAPDVLQLCQRTYEPALGMLDSQLHLPTSAVMPHERCGVVLADRTRP